jgi:outer membrane protein TolC
MSRTPDTLSSLIVFAVVMACGVSGAGTLHARQAPAQSGAKPAATAGAQDPAPVIQFPAQGITLDEAVKIALQHDPELKRSQANVQFAEGRAQELGGAFDYTLRGNAEYTHRTQELGDNAKEEQRLRRQDLQDFLDENVGFLNDARRLKPLLDQLRTSPPGSLPLDEIARINPALSSTLSVLDQLILTEPNPATRASLIATRNSLLTDVSNDLGTTIAEIETDVASKSDELQKLGPAPVDDVFIDANAVVKVDKLFRSSLFMSPFFSATFQSTNFKGKIRDPIFGGKGFPDQLQFKAGVDFGLSLLRGRGAVGTAALERAAGFDVEAARLARDHQSSRRMLATVEAYWNVRAAQEVVAIATVSLQFQEQVLTATRQLIAAQQVAAIEEARALAARSRVQSQLEDAERQLVEARVALADAMGVAVTADPATLPRAADAFPQAPAEPLATGPLVDQALSSRLDLSAAAKATEAGQAIVAGARRNLASQLDVTGGTWFTALGEGAGKEVLDRWVGPSGRIGLDYEKPLGNNRQQGQLLQAEAEAAERRIAHGELQRQIRLGVIEAAGSLQQASARLVQAQAAVGYYDRTIESMLRLLATGNARLIDALTTQQQQNDAKLMVVSAQLELAARLARLRFQTGTLLPAGTPPREPAARAREKD